MEATAVKAVVVGSLVVLRSGNGAVQADGHGQHRQRDCPQGELLLHDEPADRRRDQQHVVGQRATLALRQPHLLTVVLPELHRAVVPLRH
jgi:hypothetical protein